MTKKYWQILLTEWRKLGRDGFTIPFIVGSQKFLGDTHEVQDIKELITDIIQNEELVVCIKYCWTTEDIVLEILYESKKLPGYFPPYMGATQSRLFLTQFLKDLGTDCESIISSFIEKYQNYIDKGEFSKNDRQRGDYLPVETIFIKKSFANLIASCLRNSPTSNC